LPLSERGAPVTGSSGERAIEVCIEQRARLRLVAGEQVSVEVDRDLMPECPMYVQSACALTPAAMLMLA
jgi:hypothetical protein